MPIAVGRRGVPGLNLAGSFNTENETVVDPPPTEDDADKDGYDFYTRFWSIQGFFANPRTCLDAVGWVRLNSVRPRSPSRRAAGTRSPDLSAR